MPYLVADQQRYALRPGRNVLGGRGADAVAMMALADMPPAAVVTVRPDGTVLIQRISAAVIVRVDGGPLGAMPHPLTDGARIAVGSARFNYVAKAIEPDPTAVARTSPAHEAEAGDDKPGTPTAVIQVMAAPVAAGRLIELGTGCVYPVPRDGVVIGRGDDCDIPVDDPGVSRRHAVVKPVRAGFTISDESANGTFVNGARLVGAQNLKHGDVVGIGTEEFRVDIDAGPFAAAFGGTTASADGIGAEPDPDPLGLTSQRQPSAPRVAEPPPQPTPLPPSTPALASLEVSRGPLGGRMFRVERPVCAVGRGEHNDVRLNHPSVSASHATLLLKRGTWYVVDLQSANGTYVDGYRVATERALPDGGSLHVGDIVLRFHLMTAARETPSATRGGGGVWRKIRRLWAGV